MDPESSASMQSEDELEDDESDEVFEGQARRTLSCVHGLTRWQAALGRLLSSAPYDTCQGSFAACGTVEDLVSPGLKVKGLGRIGLPLSKRDEDALIEIGELLPHDRCVERWH
jgi:hypothetical protein